MTEPQRHRVRVWFGQTVIAAYVGDTAHAERYEHAMRRRFSSLTITREPLAEGGRGQVVGSGPVHPSAPEVMA